MSFGFSVGDFLTVIQFANDIRKEFAVAPSQFKAISQEIKSLSIVLQDIDDILAASDLTIKQQAELGEIVNHCQSVLHELDEISKKFKELDPNARNPDGRYRKIWKKFTWDQKDIIELRSRISSNILLLNTFLGRISTQAVFMVRDGVERLHESQETRERQQERDAILDWLTPFDYLAQQNDVTIRRQVGTGQWLLHSAEFQAWIETDKPTLFCPGIPGAGKTILTSTVIDELTTRYSNDPTTAVAYIYCDFRRQDQQKIEELLSSLLKQLAVDQPSLPSSVKDLYNNHKNNRARPSRDEISRCLLAVTDLYSQVFLVVDAIDECQLANSCRSQLLSIIFDLQAKRGVKLFATSRPILDIEREFKGCLSVEILAQDEDVKRYLNGNMSQLMAFVSRKPELQEEITTEIAKAVKGMFLLAYFYLRSLEDKTTPKAIKATLKQLQKQIQGPSKDRLALLSSVYDQAMDRINGQREGLRILAKKALSWITCVNRPLTTAELLHALAVKIGDSSIDEDNISQIEDIVSVCAGLVTVDEESSIVRLVHYTTQEYFQETQKRWFLDAEADITKSCLTYLSFDVFRGGPCNYETQFEDRLKLNCFYNYASHNWGHHARKATIVLPEIFEFLKRKAQVDASSQGLLVKEGWFQYCDNFPNKTTPLHLAAYFGITLVVERLLEEKADIAATDRLNRTPLHWAATNGHVDVVEQLLRAGSGFEAADHLKEVPLLSAIRNRHVNVIKLLLEKGADVETPDIWRETPLFWASGYGHFEVVELLLAKGANSEVIDGHKQTPLSRAILNNQFEVVQLLLTKGSNVEGAKGNRQTPLHQAAELGLVSIVNLLLKHGANIEAADEQRQTPLYCASWHGHFEVVKLLLEEGANIEGAEEKGRTPLHEAAGEGLVDLVNLLLKKGANIEAVDEHRQTPLYLASQNGHVEVVELLLKHGANSAVVDNKGENPVHWAAQSGPYEIVKLSLESKAGVEKSNVSGELE